MKLRYLFKNKIFLYLSTRYLTYGMQFLTSLIIAAKLGPYYMGIWGFILLILNYFQQCHFGIANSLQILLIHNKNNKQISDRYISNAILLMLYISLIVLVLYIVYSLSNDDVFSKYHIKSYAFEICLIAILQYFQYLFINILRVRNYVNEVAFCQSIIVVLNFFAIFFVAGETLINLLLLGYILGNVLCLLIVLRLKIIPMKKNFHLSSHIQKEILKKGFYLFLYNSCFYFIIVSVRTIISIYYTVDKFGIFSFAFTLGHAVLLLIGAFSFLVFPKIVDKLSSNDYEAINRTLVDIRTTYISIAHFLIYVALIIFPVLLHFLPQYKSGLIALNLIALTFLLDINSFGYLTFLIAQNKEKITAYLSLGALILNCILAMFTVVILKWDYSYVIIATMIVYLLFSFIAMVIACKQIGYYSHKYILKNFMPLKLLIPFCIAIVSSVLQNDGLLAIPLITYLILNRHDIRKILLTVKKLINTPTMIDV